MSILIVSIVLQFTAAFLALRLIKVTGNRLSWILISSAIILMGVRRCITLFRLLSGDIEHSPDHMAESVALLISVLLVAGIFHIHVYFQQIKDSEEKRQQAENLLVRFGRILDNSFNEIFVFDAQSLKFIQANVGACRNLNYSIEELMQLTPIDLKPDYTRETFEELILPLRNGHNPMLTFETIHKRKDGTLYPVEIRLQLMKDESPPVFVAIVQNITKRKKDEKMLTNYSNKLERSNKELEDFAFIASHDLQEPLRKTIILGERLKNNSTNLDENSLGYIQSMEKSCLRMKHFIEDLLHYSRITIEQLPFSPVDLNKVVQTICEDMDHIINSVNAVVNIKNLPVIECDKTQLHQLFSNLILNACKFKVDHRAPVINISGRKSDDNYWEITVEDNGIGFDEKHADKIFQPFQRLNSKNKYEGSGIGLSICKKIIDHHKGTISVKSAPCMGSTFTIRLPAMQS